MNLQSRETSADASRSESRDATQAADAAQIPGPHLGASSIVFFSVWVSVCSVAPESIWQGLLVVIHHLSWTSAGEVLLVGAVVAFFVEPIVERLRAMRLNVAHEHRSPAHVTFAAFGFAVLAIFVHEAITSFVSASSANSPGQSGLFIALSIVLQWSGIPFLVTIAWLCTKRSRWIAWTTLLLASGFVFSLGFIFGWSIQDTFTTAIPCACILFAGHAVMRRHQTQLALSYCVQVIAMIAFLWLATAGLVQLALSVWAPKNWYIYSWMEYAIDFRFYAGWAIGLAVAPRTVMHR